MEKISQYIDQAKAKFYSLPQNAQTALIVGVGVVFFLLVCW